MIAARGGQGTWHLVVKRLLENVEARRLMVVFVRTLDR